MSDIIINKIDNIKYLSHFVMRAFLIAVITFLCGVFILLFIYFGDLLLNVSTGNYSNPLFNGYVVVSSSMTPTIKVNDAIVIKRMNNDNYNVNDIISFVSNDKNYLGSVITHRIVEKNFENNISVYTTKGDHNKNNDPFAVYSNMINGKVLFKIPKLGYVQSFISKPINFIYCMIVCTLIILVCNFYRIVKVVNAKEK